MGKFEKSWANAQPSDTQIWRISPPGNLYRKLLYTSLTSSNSGCSNEHLLSTYYVSDIIVGASQQPPEVSTASTHFSKEQGKVHKGYVTGPKVQLGRDGTSVQTQATCP